MQKDISLHPVDQFLAVKLSKVRNRTDRKLETIYVQQCLSTAKNTMKRFTNWLGRRRATFFYVVNDLAKEASSYMDYRKHVFQVDRHTQW